MKTHVLLGGGLLVVMLLFLARLAVVLEGPPSRRRTSIVWKCLLGALITGTVALALLMSSASAAGEAGPIAHGYPAAVRAGDHVQQASLSASF